MYTVYLIQSVSHPDQTYIGMTSDFKKRLLDHNYGHSRHTSKFKPWKTVITINFPDKHQALAFESYLKSGSGRAFSKKHFLIS